MIYLASPYRHPDPFMVVKRVREVCEATARLLTKGYRAYSPISHFHLVAVFGGFTESDRHIFLDHDKYMIGKADEMWILTIGGWDLSKGIKQEMEWAKELNIPIRRIAMDELMLLPRKEKCDA